MQSFYQTFKQRSHFQSVLLCMYQSHFRGSNDSQYRQKSGQNEEKKLLAESDCVHSKKIKKKVLNLRLQVICSVNNMHGERGRGKRITKLYIATTLKIPRQIFHIKIRIVKKNTEIIFDILYQDLTTVLAKILSSAGTVSECHQLCFTLC